MIGTTKTLNHQNLRDRLYAGSKCISRKSGRLLAAGNLADPARHHPHHHCHHHRFPYLEAQT